MKKVITVFSAVVVLTVSVISNHLTVEKQWAVWKLYGMEIEQKAYNYGKTNGWTMSQSEQYAKEQLDRKGIKKPGFCLYCWCWGLTHK